MYKIIKITKYVLIGKKTNNAHYAEKICFILNSWYY